MTCTILGHNIGNTIHIQCNTEFVMIELGWHVFRMIHILMAENLPDRG